MTQKQLIAHRTALSQKRAELKSSLALHANTKILAGDRLTDSLDQSAHALETVVQVRLRENQSRLLRAIEAALDRIDRGTFGDCESCRQSIPAVRLSAQAIEDRKAVDLAEACVENRQVVAARLE